MDKTVYLRQWTNMGKTKTAITSTRTPALKAMFPYLDLTPRDLVKLRLDAHLNGYKVVIDQSHYVHKSP